MKKKIRVNKNSKNSGVCKGGIFPDAVTCDVNKIKKSKSKSK